MVGVFQQVVEIVPVLEAATLEMRYYVAALQDDAEGSEFPDVADLHLDRVAEAVDLVRVYGNVPGSESEVGDIVVRAGPSTATKAIAEVQTTVKASANAAPLLDGRMLVQPLDGLSRRIGCQWWQK